MQLPEGDRHMHSREFLEAQIAVLMAGRAAEEIFLGQATSGAANDIERATEMARRMVCEFGMSPMGPLAFRAAGDNSKGAGLSEATAMAVDDEIRRLVMRGDETAREILNTSRGGVEKLANALLLEESVDAAAVHHLLASAAS
jgi:cell division protease FtsH